MAKNPQKSAFQITSPCYCWLWDCDKNKTKTCTFLTSQWVCIHKIVWNRLTLMNMCWDGKVPAFRENEAIKSKWTTNHKMFKDRTKIETPIIFLFVPLNFFSPRNFDTFHLNKNRNHSRTSYKTTGQWNKKKKALCAVLKISGVCVPKKYWVNDNNCGVHLQGCCGEFLCLTPPQGSGPLHLVHEEKYTQSQLTAAELCFYGSEAKRSDLHQGNAGVILPK